MVAVTVAVAVRVGINVAVALGFAGLKKVGVCEGRVLGVGEEEEVWRAIRSGVASAISFCTGAEASEAEGVQAARISAAHNNPISLTR